MNYRYCLGQDGHALQRNVDTLLLAVKQADGCEPRHVRCDRKRKRSFSGLSGGRLDSCGGNTEEGGAEGTDKNNGDNRTPHTEERKRKKEKHDGKKHGGGVKSMAHIRSDKR